MEDIFLLCEEGRSQNLEALLKTGFDPNIFYKEKGFTPLHIVCNYYRGYTECARLLLDYGANVNAGDYELRTPLHPSAYVSTTELLLFYGANPHLQDKSGKLALHYSCWSNSNKSVELLIKNQTSIEDTNHQDLEGNTPLHFAVFWNRKSHALLLLQHGANTQIKNKNSYIPLELAEHNKFHDIVDLLLSHNYRTLNPALKR